MAKNGYDQTYEDDRKENEETKDLVPRAGRMLKEKLDEDLTGGAYVGSRLNMPSNTRLGKLNAEDTALLNKQDATLEGQKAATTRMRKTNPEYFGYDEMKKSGMKKGGKVKKMASGGMTRGDGLAQRGKTKGRMV